MEKSTDESIQRLGKSLKLGGNVPSLVVTDKSRRELNHEHYRCDESEYEEAVTATEVGDFDNFDAGFEN